MIFLGKTYFFTIFRSQPFFWRIIQKQITQKIIIPQNLDSTLEAQKVAVPEVRTGPTLHLDDGLGTQQNEATKKQTLRRLRPFTTFVKEDMVITYCLGAGFQILYIFTPIPGEMIQFN